MQGRVRLHILSLMLTALAACAGLAWPHVAAAGPLAGLLCLLASLTALAAMWSERQRRRRIVGQLRQAVADSRLGTPIGVTSQPPAELCNTDLGAAVDALVAVCNERRDTSYDRIHALKLRLAINTLSEDDERVALDRVAAGLTEALAAIDAPNSATTAAGQPLAPSPPAGGDDGDRRPVELRPAWLTLVSHTLRTPLTSVRAYAEMLLDSDSIEGSQREHVHRVIYGESCRLSQAVDNFLNLASLRAGTLRPVTRPVSFRELLQAAHRNALPVAEAFGVTLPCPVGNGETPCRVDYELMLQSVTNLLVRSIVCGGEGQTVGVELVQDGSRLQLRVRYERGGGDRKTVFERTQGELEGELAADQPQQELGWMLSRYVVQTLHGGNLQETDVGDLVSIIQLSLPSPDSAWTAEKRVNS